MTSASSSRLAFVGFAASLIYPSTAVFEKVGLPYLAAYVLLAPFLLWSALHLVPRLRARISPRAALIGLVLLHVALLCAHLWVHPQIDTSGFRLFGLQFGASDGDDAIDLAITEALAGRYPYHATTFLGNPITPMPGSILLAVPFYVLGSSSIQSVFWLMIFFWAVAAHHRDWFTAAIVSFSVFVLSPNVIYQVLRGGDYITNSVSILVFSGLLLESTRRGHASWQRALWALLLGVSLSSRLNFLPLLPLLLGALARASSLTGACSTLALVLAAFGALTVPAVLYDPSGFSPLHTLSKLDVTGRLPWAPYLVALLAFALSTALAVRRESYELRVFMRDVFFIEAFLAVTGFVLASISSGRVNLDYPHFGVLFMFFGIFAFAPGSIPISQESFVASFARTPRAAPTS